MDSMDKVSKLMNYVPDFLRKNPSTQEIPNNLPHLGIGIGHTLERGNGGYYSAQKP